MNYIVAKYGIRTEGTHSDLVACGVRGFAPFVVDTLDQEPAMILHTDRPLSTDDYPCTMELSRFNFEMDLAECLLCRYESGYIFTMVKGERKFIFVKGDNSNEVLTNVGVDGPIDAFLLRFALWLMFGLCIAPLGGIAIHSSVIVANGGAVLCLGESGTGKSTHTRLWREHIAGAQLLNDDSPIIRMVDGVATAFGSPWSGKTPCYRNLHFPIRGFIRLSQAPYNKIHRLPVLNAIGALLPSCPPAFAHDDTLQDNICDTLSQMIAGAPVFHLECLPDAAAAQLSFNTIFGA